VAGFQRLPHHRDLFEFYGINARSSDEMWKPLAIALARDFVPGLLVANISPSETALMEEARLRAALNAVAAALKKRRDSLKDHVAERTALEHDFFNKRPWRSELFGEKPDSVGTLATRFVRDKERLAKLLLGRAWRKEQVIAAFEAAGLEVPGFVHDLPDLRTLADLGASMPGPKK
jgi:hypothetical protein